MPHRQDFAQLLNEWVWALDLEVRRAPGPAEPGFTLYLRGLVDRATHVHGYTQRRVVREEVFVPITSDPLVMYTLMGLPDAELLARQGPPQSTREACEVMCRARHFVPAMALDTALDHGRVPPLHAYVRDRFPEGARTRRAEWTEAEAAAVARGRAEVVEAVTACFPGIGARLVQAQAQARMLCAIEDRTWGQSLPHLQEALVPIAGDEPRVSMVLGQTRERWGRFVQLQGVLPLHQAPPQVAFASWWAFLTAPDAHAFDWQCLAPTLCP